MKVGKEGSMTILRIDVVLQECIDGGQKGGDGKGRDRGRGRKGLWKQRRICGWKERRKEKSK